MGEIADEEGVGVHRQHLRGAGDSLVKSPESSLHFYRLEVLINVFAFRQQRDTLQ